MRALIKTVLPLLLAGLLGGAYARSGGTGKEGSGLDKGNGQFGGMITAESAKQRLQQVTDNFSRLQSLPTLQTSPDAASQMWAIQDLISKAQAGLTAGNNQAVFELCAQIDKRIGDLYVKEKTRVRTGSGPGPGFPGDSARDKEIQNTGILYDLKLDLDQTSERIEDYSQRLASGKNPCAAEVLQKIQRLMDQARQTSGSGQAVPSRGYLTQAKALIPELQRLTQENSSSEKQGSSDLLHGACADQQPAVQSSLAQVSETYHRLVERYTRLTEQSTGNENPKAASVKARIQDFLDKAKEALSTSQPEAAKEFCLKAESLLPELRGTVSATGGDRLTPAAWQRLKAKLDRAAEIVAAAGNDKASKILEKGQEHFERAQRNQADGQAARAEVEMDIALKLAAKAVDIARANGR